MIKNISLEMPWGLKLDRSFAPWINIIQQPNGYWKSILLNSIASLWSRKFIWFRSLPGFISINNWDYILKQGKWFGNLLAEDELLEYLLPWRFFTLNTPNQRRLFTRLLDLDKEEYMKERIPEWTSDMKSRLTKAIKEMEMMNKILADDIIRLTNEIKNFKQEDHTEIENKIKQWDELRKEILTFNNSLDYSKRDALVNKRSEIENELAKAQMQLENNKRIEKLIKEKQEEVIKDKCPSCNQKLSSIKFKSIEQHRQEEIEKLKSQLVIINLEDIQKRLDKVRKEIDELPTPKAITSVSEWCEVNQIDFTPPTEEELQWHNQYKEALAWVWRMKTELELKKQQQKENNFLKLQMELDNLIDIEREFTQILQDKIKESGIEIELFETLQNWNEKETFIPTLDWVPYKELSRWNQLRMEIKISKLIADYFDIKTLLIDEVWLLSDISLLKELEWQWYQIIAARATPFTI